MISFLRVTWIMMSSLFENIKTILPASYKHFKINGTISNKYWDIYNAAKIGKQLNLPR